MTATISPDQFLDPLWRIHNLYKCMDKNGKSVKFTPWDEQREFLDAIHNRSCILKCRQRGFCLDPSTRVLTADLTWVAIGDLAVGREIIGVDEYALKRGKGQHRKMRTAVVEGVVQVERKAYRITFDDGRSVICTGQHPWLSAPPASKIGRIEWRKIDGPGKKRLKVGSAVRWVTKPWQNGDVEDGWFGGILDGEGSIAKSNSSASINAAQRRGVVWDRMISYGLSRGYRFKVEEDVALRASKLGSTPIPKMSFGRMDEIFRLIGQTRPSRFIGNRFWEGRELPGKKSGIGWATIISIETLGDQTMIDLQTSTGTYIAEGFVSHNTTLMGIVQLDDCLFNPNVRAAILAHRDSAAKLIFQDKVKFPYDNLDEGLRAAIPPKQDSADTLALANNSRFIVTTSVRSGTLKWLHVSEYGKICAENPERAREIRTGSFPAAEGGVITIESTAEGESGDFFDLCTSAEALLNAGADLTRKDFKFFFYPWWRAKEYVLPRTNVPIGPDDEKYFLSIAQDIMAISFLAPHFRGFTQEQKNWWVTEANRLGSDMKREFPATPREAFEQSLDGAIFASEIASAYKFERIGSFPLDTRYPVNTFWDLGHSHGNATAVWLEQDIANVPRFVGYYEREGETIDQHLRNLKEWAAEHGVSWGQHYMPHDGDKQDIWLPEGTLALMGRLGFNPKIVQRAPNKWESIQVARRQFPQCYWDAAACKLGLSRLKQYRKEFDDRRGVWRDYPYHGPESNGADAFRTFAESGHTTPAAPKYDESDAHRRKFYDRGSKESWLTA